MDRDDAKILLGKMAELIEDYCKIIGLKMQVCKKFDGDEHTDNLHLSFIFDGLYETGIILEFVAAEENACEKEK